MSQEGNEDNSGYFSGFLEMEVNRVNCSKSPLHVEYSYCIVMLKYFQKSCKVA